MRCLAKDPERRPASVAELRRALQAGIAAERARVRRSACRRRQQAAGPSAQPEAAAKPAAAGP